MIIIMKQGTTHEHVEELSQHIERWNVKANPIYGEDTIVIGLVGDTGAVDKDALMLDPQVENIIKVQEPFKLANRKFHPDNSVVEIAPGVVVGGKKLVVMDLPVLGRERGADHRRCQARSGGRRDRSPRRCVEAAFFPVLLPGSEG